MGPVLSLNAGSSSLKFALFRVGTDEELLAQGAVERVGEATSRRWARTAKASHREDIPGIPDLRGAAVHVLEQVDALDVPAPAAVGHRLVHGGPKYHQPARLDEPLLRDLRGLKRFAPLHLPGEIAVIEAARAYSPDLPQVACFDTAFHHDLPQVAKRFALPDALWDAGVRRYGFHGLSYEYVMQALGEDAHGRLVIAHLGNGASLAAVRDGSPVDTTMGLTPAGGLVMGTRTGDLDPGVLTFVARHNGWDLDRLDHLVNFESGMLGVSGTSADMESLLARRDSDSRAALAVELFCRSVRKHIGAFAAVLGGLDTLVFTGGIGEHAAAVRAEICQGLEFLGVRLDARRNDAHAEVLSTADAACQIRRITTDEDRMIARHTARVLGGVG